MPETNVNSPTAPDAKVGDPARVIVIPLPRRLAVGSLLGVVLLGTVVMLVIAAHVFAKIAPEDSPEAMGALVAWVWLYHVVNIFRRRHTIARGLLRAAAFAALTAVMIAAGLYLSRL